MVKLSQKFSIHIYNRDFLLAEVLETKGTSCLIKFGDGAVHQVQEIYIRPVTKTVT